MWSKQGAFLQRPSRTWGSRSQSLKGAPQGAGNSTGYLCSERSGWGLGGDGGRDGGGMKEGHCAAVGWRTAPPCGTAPSWLQGQGLHTSPPPPPAPCLSFTGARSPQPRGQHLPCLSFPHCSTPRLGLRMQHSTGAASPGHPQPAARGTAVRGCGQQEGMVWGQIDSLMV